MKKFLVMAAVALLAGSQAYAQLSEGETTSRVIKVGNRPQAGSFGIYMGATGEMFNDMFDKNTEFKSLPLVNIKYMLTDQLEARVGLQFYKKSESASVTTEVSKKDYTTKYQYLTTENRIYPGLAYHFSPRNLLDVYAGAELLLGWNREKNQSVDDDDYTYGMGSLTGFQFGGGAFIGLQAFLGDLPVALGLEYGFHGYGNYGQKYKLETKDGDVYTVNAAEFKNLPAYNMTGKKVSASKAQFGQQVRVTLSYYFNL